MVLGEVEQRALGTWALLEEAGFLYLATKCNRSVKPTCGRRVASGSAAMGGGYGKLTGWCREVGGHR